MKKEMRLLNIIKYAYSNFQTKEHVNLYADIAESIVAIEDKMNIKFDENHLHCIIKMVYERIAKNNFPPNFRKLNYEIRSVILLITEAIFTKQICEAWNKVDSLVHESNKETLKQKSYKKKSPLKIIDRKIEIFTTAIKSLDIVDDSQFMLLFSDGLAEIEFSTGGYLDTEEVRRCIYFLFTHLNTGEYPENKKGMRDYVLKVISELNRSLRESYWFLKKSKDGFFQDNGNEELYCE